MKPSGLLKTWMVVILLLVWRSDLAGQDLNMLKAGVVRVRASVGPGVPTEGTGFIIRVEPERVFIVTAAHVVGGDPAPKVEFFTKRDQLVAAAVRHSETEDEQRGLALLVVVDRTKIPDGLHALDVAPSVALSGTEDVLVIGFPRVLPPWSVTTGRVVSTEGRDIIVDAAVDKGNSGGPLLRDGHVVGIVMGEKGKFGRVLSAESLLTYAKGNGIQVAGAGGAAMTTEPAPPPVSPPPSLPKEITGKDGAPMVVIPAGEFLMGSVDGEGGGKERPQHRVALDAFYMDEYEVTVARYAKFLQVRNRPNPKFWDQVDLAKHSDRPVVGIDWHDAQAYCAWAGKRLPTEAEWEYAARGTDGRRYPWGNAAPRETLANYGQEWNYSHGWSDIYSDRLKPVGSYDAGKSFFGVYDMAGNVWEWVADWYDSEYYSTSPERNPKGPATGEFEFRVLRGGSWDTRPVALYSANRSGEFPANGHLNLGVRCARDAP